MATKLAEMIHAHVAQARNIKSVVVKTNPKKQSLEIEI